MALGNQRTDLDPEEFERRKQDITHRFDQRWWRSSSDPDCQRIYDRLRRHKDELLLFLDEPAVPPDNDADERDFRSVAAARADGGVNRTAWGAKAFAVAKTIVRTCQKSGLNFFAHALEALRSQDQSPLSLPIADTS